MITVVDVIPAALSGESHQDSEPNIAVNPANPAQIAITAFTPDPMGGSNAPIYISTDGGATWSLNSIVPSAVATTLGTYDITARFAGRGGKYYAGILREIISNHPRLNVLRSADFTAPVAMGVIDDRVGLGLDQPFTQATTVMGGADAGKDRVYVGVNDFNAPGGRTATVEQSLDAGVAVPTFTPSRLEQRSTGTAGQNGPQIRPAVHPDGTVYAVFYGWRSFGAGGAVTADVVVARDDNWGNGANPFTALVDPGDGLAGRRVVTGVNFTWNGTLAQERLGGDLAIAAAPDNSSTVYIAYCDVQAGAYTMHIRRSLDRGVTWSPDLRTISNAKNPALAINSQGRVGLAYQRVTGAGASQRWDTHVELTSDGFATSTDAVLATTPANIPVAQFLPYLGDYIGMMAVGKDFYGVFCANNTPDTANFPNGVTFLRNHDFATKKLLANDGVTQVAVSIDPFFFKISEVTNSSDLYLRDWTDTAVSHDTGLEPSTNPSFYENPDVWNRRTNAPGGFNANDQPVNEDPQMAALGSNFAFCRVSRNATGTVESVTAHFLYSEFGTGSNYQDANVTPDPTIGFATGDGANVMAAGYEWLLPATSSTHLCLAVEINSPNDPLKLPSLVGRAPGWPTTDLLVINDNNKAQRNMGVYAVAGGASGTVSFYAIAHNAATFVRDMVLVLDTTAKAAPLLKGAVVEIIDSGGKTSTQPFQPGQSVVLSKMLPGDNAWIGVTLQVPAGKVNTIIPVTVHEVVDGKAVNGFTIAPRLSRTTAVYQTNLELHAGFFQRIASSLGLSMANDEASAALGLARKGRLTGKGYVGLLAARQVPLSGAVEQLLAAGLAPDAFGLRDAMASLSKVSAAASASIAPAAHSTFLHKLDAYATMVQKAQGDPADIMQTVAWQADLFKALKDQKGLPTGDEVIKASEGFVAAYQARKAGNADYPPLISSLFGALKDTATALNLNLDAELAALQKAQSGSLASLQKAHRDYLLRLLATLN